MKKLAILILILIPILICAKEKAISDYPQLSMGTDTDGNDVMCYSIPLKGKIKRFLPAWDSPYLVISDETEVRVYDIRTLEPVTKIKPGLFVTEVTDSGFLVVQEASFPALANYQTSFYNTDGKRIWKKNGPPTFTNRTINTIIFTKDYNTKLIGASMSTNKTLWEKTIPCKSNHPKHHILCESYMDKKANNLYLISDDLIRINVITGDTIMRRFNLTGSTNFFKALSHDFSDSRIPENEDLIKELYFSKGIENICGLHSNWIVRGDSMIIADADNIYCFDKDFKTIWQTALPQKMGAKSRIRLIGDHIQFLNYGIGFSSSVYNLSYFSYGKPFGATYSISDGKQLSFTLPTVKNKIIGGLYTDSGRIYFQTRKGFSYCNENDSILHKIEWTPQIESETKEDVSGKFICDSIFIIKDGFIKSIKSDDKRLVVQINKRDVNVINPEDGNCLLIPSEEVFFHNKNGVYYTSEDQNGRQNFVIVDSKTQKVKQKLSLKDGCVFRDDYDNIIIYTKQSVFFHKSDKTE